MFNIKCDAGEENLCIHTITQLTSNVVERGGRDQAGFVSILPVLYSLLMLI